MMLGVDDCTKQCVVSVFGELCKCWFVRALSTTYKLLGAVHQMLL